PFIARTWPILLRLFFFTGTSPTELDTLSLHDALPILRIVIIYISARPSTAGFRRQISGGEVEFGDHGRVVGGTLPPAGGLVDGAGAAALGQGRARQDQV